MVSFVYVVRMNLNSRENLVLMPIGLSSAFSFVFYSTVS